MSAAVYYLYHFISFAKPTKKDSVLILLDNYKHHIILGAYQLLREHNLHVLPLSPTNAVIGFDYLHIITESIQSAMWTLNGWQYWQYMVEELFTNEYNKTTDIKKDVSGLRVTDKFKESFETFITKFTSRIMRFSSWSYNRPKFEQTHWS